MENSHENVEENAFKNWPILRMPQIKPQKLYRRTKVEGIRELSVSYGILFD